MQYAHLSYRPQLHPAREKRPEQPERSWDDLVSKAGSPDY